MRNLLMALMASVSGFFRASQGPTLGIRQRATSARQGVPRRLYGVTREVYGPTCSAIVLWKQPEMTRIMSHCHPHQPAIICEGRAEAKSRGAFLWDMRIQGYICTDLPVRKASFRAKYYNLDEHDGEHYRLEICCFCGMQLPELFPEGREMSVTDGDEGFE